LGEFKLQYHKEKKEVKNKKPSESDSNEKKEDTSYQSLWDIAKAMFKTDVYNDEHQYQKGR
jgi:hypothetical protein